MLAELGGLAAVDLLSTVFVAQLLTKGSGSPPLGRYARATAAGGLAALLGLRLE